MGYQRQTWVLRGSGGRGMGFLVYERGERQDSLRCQLKDFAPDASARLLAMAAGGDDLVEIGEIRFTKTGGAEQSFSLAGDARLIGAAVVGGAAQIWAVGWAAGGEAWPAERVQMAARALLMPEPRKPQRVQTKSAPAPEPARAEGIMWPPEWMDYRAAYEALLGCTDGSHPDWQCALRRGTADARGLAIRTEQGKVTQVAALWAGQSWPPPPGLIGARFDGGVWLAPIAPALTVP